MMELSIWSQYYYELKAEESVERLIKNGIFASELSDEHGAELLARDEDFIKTGKEFKKFLDDRNFNMSQGHLWLRIRICENEEAVPKLLNWIDMYEVIGIKNMVLHCDPFLDQKLPKEERARQNVEKLKIVAEHIKDKDITICLENLRLHYPEEPDLVDRTADDLLDIIQRIGSDRFGICLDTGHLNMTDKNPREFILKAGKKLKALHIADNEEKEDQHLMPFTRGTVDFVEVVKALREVGYEGLFNLEIPGEIIRTPIELRDEKIKYIKASYDYLMNI